MSAIIRRRGLIGSDVYPKIFEWDYTEGLNSKLSTSFGGQYDSATMVSNGVKLSAVGPSEWHTALLGFDTSGFPSDYNKMTCEITVAGQNAQISQSFFISGGIWHPSLQLFYPNCEYIYAYSPSGARTQVESGFTTGVIKFVYNKNEQKYYIYKNNSVLATYSNVSQPSFGTTGRVASCQTNGGWSEIYVIISHIKFTFEK